MPTKSEQLRQAMEEAGLDSSASYKPGFSGMGGAGAIYDPRTGIALDGSGKQITYQVEKTDDTNKYRIGDYTYTGSGYKLVENSPTDIVNRYIKSDARSRQGLSITDWFNAAGKAVMGFMGLPTNDTTGDTVKDLAGMAATTAVGQVMKSNIYTRALWAAGSALSSLNEANARYLDDYLNQDFNYELTGVFERDKDGNLKFKPDYKKMADAGVESGSDVKNAQSTENTKVSINGDNNLTMRVSPAFAASDAYTGLLNNLKDKISNLTVDNANEVVDKDTGKTMLQAIEDLVKTSELNYYYNVQTVKNIKEKAPTASDEALNLGVEVSKTGYQSEDTLLETVVSIYNDKNELEKVNAKEWLDGIYAKNDVERENYMLSLGNRIADPNISDDEKAVLYGQSIALYAASDNDGDYKGMYQKDFFDAVGSSPEAFTGLTWNQIFGFTELTTFREDELSSGFLKLATTVASVKALSSATNLLEKGARKITPSISKWAGEGGLKSALGSTSENASTLKNLATIAGKTGTQLVYQVAADAMYDAAKIVPYALSGNMEEYDFLKELQSDVAMDMLVTYGPGQFVGAMNSPKQEYRVLVEDTKTGEVEYKRPSDIKGDNNYKIITNNAGERDAKLVEVTADELAARRAETLIKLSDSKVGQKVQELFFDKNASMQKLALWVRAKSDQYHYRKFLRYTNDIRQVTSDTLRDFLHKENVSKNWETLGKTLKETGETIGKISKSDWNYIKAVTNEYRFLEKQEGDKKSEQIVKDFYKDAKEAVTPERAEQLEKLMGAMRTVANDVMDFYVEKGLVTPEKAEEIRNAPGYANGMYLPMYTKGGVKGGGVIGQDRVLFKKVDNPDALIGLNDIDNPMNSLARYVNNAMRAVAVNDRALAIREAASIAGVGIRVVADTGDVLKEVKNLRSMDERFDKIFKGIAARTRNSLPTFKEWQETNGGLVLRSKAYKSAQELSKLRDEAKDYRRQLRNEQRRKNPNAEKIAELKKSLKENSAKRLETTDNVKRYIGLVMERAQKAHKGSKVKLDIDSYLANEVTNSLKSALRAGNMVGEVQKVINEAVENANPWVDPAPIIRERARNAAERYRAKVAEEMEAQRDTLGDKFNMAVDRVMDYLTEKATGEKAAEITIIDEGDDPTTILSNHGQKNVIRYRLNGEIQEMRLAGNGAEQLVDEFYAPDFVAPKTTAAKVGRRIMNLGNKIAQGKRYLTTSVDIARVLPNLARDWSRGIVMTGGQILISPDKFFNDLITEYGYSEAQVKQIKNGLMLARGSVSEDTLTASLQMPSKNREKSMIRAMTEPDGNAFTRFAYDLKAGEIGKILSRPQDTAETFTRKRAMDTAYYKELADSQAKGLSLNESIKRATEAAYFYGREATVNFYRRGTLIGKIAQQVPYLSQRFASIESAKLAYLDDPIRVTRALETTVSSYAALIAIALSNEESRQKYYMLSEYDRANNIIIPINNNTIMTIPLDETVAAFLTPYRRMVETLNGVDPQAFYLCFAEGLEALSPIDLSGFSEGDGFNIARGFDKLEAEFVPTWAQPFLEMWKGRDLYYGSNLAIDSDYTGAVYDDWSPTSGALTTKSKNSQMLRGIADRTGIPQWILQNFLAEYGGNVGQYVLNTVDKLSGATEEAQGGKEWQDSIFKPFTGSDSNQAQSAFYDAVNQLKAEKKKVQGQIATLTQKIKGAAYEEKADLINQRQEIISKYGTKVSDTLNQYLSAFNLTGGLSKSQANQAWYLFKLYDDNGNANMYLEGSSGGYYSDKADAYAKKQQYSLAASSGLDKYVHSPVRDYNDSYAEKAFEKTVYGYGTEQMAELASILENTEDYNNSLTKLRKDVKKARSDAYARKDYTTMSALAYNYDREVANAIYPYLLQNGVAETLDKTAVMNYLKEWFIVPSEEQLTATGRYVPNLGTDSEKSEAFKKQFIKKIFGVSGQ